MIFGRIKTSEEVEYRTLCRIIKEVLAKRGGLGGDREGPFIHNLPQQTQKGGRKPERGEGAP